MNQHLDDLREVGNLLDAGKLAEAQALSFMLTRPVEDPTLPSWSAEVERISSAVHSFAAASSLSEACRLLPRVAAVCTDCHDRLKLQIDARVTEHARCERIVGAR